MARIESMAAPQAPAAATGSGGTAGAAWAMIAGRLGAVAAGADPPSAPVSATTRAPPSSTSPAAAASSPRVVSFANPVLLLPWRARCTAPGARVVPGPVRAHAPVRGDTTRIPDRRAGRGVEENRRGISHQNSLIGLRRREYGAVV